MNSDELELDPDKHKRSSSSKPQKKNIAIHLQNESSSQTFFPEQINNVNKLNSTKPIVQIQKQNSSNLQEGFHLQNSHNTTSSQFKQEIVSFPDVDIEIIGSKSINPVHFCSKCELPIALYARLLPCQHIYCVSCAEHLQQCILTICNHRIDKYETISDSNSIFICNFPNCQRSYKSEYFLNEHQKLRAHIVSKSISNSNSQLIDNTSQDRSSKRNQERPPNQILSSRGMGSASSSQGKNSNLGQRPFL